MNSAKLLLAATLICCLVMAAPAAHAWRQPVLNLGLTNVLDGAAPPPGWYLSMYTVLLTAPSADVTESGGLPKSLENIDVSIAAVAPQVIWVSPYKVLGGNVGFDFFPILGTIGADTAGTGLGAGDPVNNSLVGDMVFGPFIAFHHMLGGPWQLHWVLECDGFAPVGQYDSNKALQLAKNHWSINPWVSFTLLGPHGLELSSRIHYLYNFTNDDYQFSPGTFGEMQPGQAFHLNYSVTKEIMGPKLRAGVVGYYLQQLTEDEFNDVKITNSEEEVFAVGPALWYNKGDFIFEAKCHFDTYATNRPKAVTGVMRIIYNFF